MLSLDMPPTYIYICVCVYMRPYFLSNRLHGPARNPTSRSSMEHISCLAYWVLILQLSALFLLSHCESCCCGAGNAVGLFLFLAPMYIFLTVYLPESLIYDFVDFACSVCL